MTTVRASSTFDVPPDVLFAFHADVTNLARISPPLPRFRLLSEAGEAEEGEVQRFQLSVGPFHREWHARITRVIPGKVIEDTQEAGPFREWRHRHVVSDDPSGSRLTDVVRFRLLPTPAGEFLEWLLVAPGVRLMFAWRHRRTRALLRSYLL
jgi:ligand-binding SRPBCC domain-containing protein